MKIKKIITHPGGAHKDDLLACSLVVAISGAPIVRRTPTEEELNDAEVCVIDVGYRHEPHLLNFDHHQFPREHVPTCALSLVLKNLDLYEDARLFFDWLEPAEWFDTRGPKRTADFLGISREVVSQLHSPIDSSLLRHFSGKQTHHSGEITYEMLSMIGNDLLSYLRGIRKRLEIIEAHSQYWRLEQGGQQVNVLFLPRKEEVVEDASGVMFRYLEMKGLGAQTAILIYPDTRGEGFGLARFNDHPRVDFQSIEGQEDVHFVHASGFLAKTSAQTEGRLQTLALKGWK